MTYLLVAILALIAALLKVDDDSVSVMWLICALLATLIYEIQERL